MSRTRINRQRFTAAQSAVMRSWLAEPDSGGGIRGAVANRMPVVDVHRALGLSTIAHASFLGPSCWLAGGAVMRWLCRESTAASAGDFDFYFPSPEAMTATASAMVDKGFRLRGYGRRPHSVREFFARPVREERDSGIWIDAGKPAPITPELIERLELGTLELVSPEGDRIQLVALAFDATPLDTIMHFDFSVCQLALDDHHLTFGPSTLCDLIDSRLRVVCLRWPLNTCRRMYLYGRRGYRPYVGTALRIVLMTGVRIAAFATEHLRRCGRGTLRSD